MCLQSVLVSGDSEERSAASRKQADVVDSKPQKTHSRPIKNFDLLQPSSHWLLFLLQLSTAFILAGPQRGESNNNNIVF